MKNLIIVILGVVVVVEGLLVIRYRSTKATAAPITINNNQSESAQPTRTPPPLLKKGDKFSDSLIFKYAYQIAPGDLNDAAKKAMIGFVIDRQTIADGSTVIKLTPTDSDDQNQQYTVKSGETLYFVEMTPVDDKETENIDTNLRDDYGVIVDVNGIVQ